MTYSISLFVSFIPEPNESLFFSFFLPRTSNPASTIVFLLFLNTDIILMKNIIDIMLRQNKFTILSKVLPKNRKWFLSLFQ